MRSENGKDWIYQGKHTGAEHGQTGIIVRIFRCRTCLYGEDQRQRYRQAPIKADDGYIREGDTVVVESYSRFARNTRDLLELVEQLEKKGVAFVSQKENVNTETAEGRLMFTIFAGLAQFEREQLLQRQAEGIAIAKAQGRYKGRQPIQVNQEAFVREYQAWREGKQTARETMGKLGLRPNTFYRRVKAYEQEINS